MQQEILEELIVQGFRSLCSTCRHADSCTYFNRQVSKPVIQCELFEVDHEEPLVSETPGGLCRNCDVASHCTLPGRKTGIWHCNEFQ
jgi:hypothetical protein